MFLCINFIIILQLGSAEINNDFNDLRNEENNTWADLPNLNLLHRLKNNQNYLLDQYPLREITVDQNHCRRPAKCIRVGNSTCMGITLPYATTTYDLIPVKISRSEIEAKLYLLQSLRYIPKCWAVVQPFLCSLFMPKCINDVVDLPSHEMCRLVMGPCRLIFNYTIWPKFIKCDDDKLFPRRCIHNDMREIKFNTTGKCLSPLVPTDVHNSLATFEGIDGCGLPCNDPLYTDDEKKQIHSLIAWGASICLIFNLFTVVTFLLDWRSANKYPALVIFYINCCFMISCIGWLIQFTPGSREVIVCRKDNTLRMSEPSGENLSCVIIFVMIYYSLIAAMVWFVILTYAWYISFQALGKIQDRIDKKGAYFHLLAWCLPLMLTVIIMAFGEIDGNHTTGICFVGYANHTIRAWFLLAPILIVLIVAGFFLSRALITLIRLQITSQEIISERASAKIRETVIRMGLFSVFTLSAIVVTFYCHIYEFQNSSKWKQNFRDYMICSITKKFYDVSECKLQHRPSAAKLQLHLLAPFMMGILMSSWVWTSSTVDTWIRFFKRTFNSENEEPIRLKKHKVIAQAFAKRKTFNKAGRLSISFHNTHEDPVGLNFHLNSAASQDFSSTWAAALPTLVTRRGAIALQSASISSNRRNSTDSQYSFSVRRVSVESRRNSYDSQIAVTEFELKTSRVNKGKRRKKTPERSKKRSDSYKRSRKYLEKQNPYLPPSLRKDSATSQESQLGMQILSALSISPKTDWQGAKMKRRSANAGIEENKIPLKDAERMLPFLFSNHSDSEENSSSDEKINDKEVDVETGITGKNFQKNDSENDNSQLKEDVKSSEYSNKAQKRQSRISADELENLIKNGDRIEDKSVLQQLLNGVEEHKLKNETDRNNAINNLASGLSKLMQFNNESQIKAREIATQTSLPLEILEIEELKQSIDEIINNRNCSKATQMSPLLKKNKKPPK